VTPRSALLHRSTRYVLLALVLIGSAGLLGAGPAAADTVVDCPAPGNATCAQLAPVLECVWDNGNGTMTAAWGWDNPTSNTARINLGPRNLITPGAQDQGQPTLLTPGRHQNAFVTTFTGQTTRWKLSERDDKVDPQTAACATKPVPQVGSVAALAMFVLMLGFAALVVVSARGRSVATA
jgi:hypothetical protein